MKRVLVHGHLTLSTEDEDRLRRYYVGEVAMNPHAAASAEQVALEQVCQDRLGHTGFEVVLAEELET